ncbi:hypothetical protein ACWCQN_25100 [Streptomyces sp. NPDC001984]
MPEQLADVRAREDARVATAEQEAEEAVALVDALEEKVRDGDDTVTPEELANRRELGSFAKLRAEATRRKAEKAKRAARLTVCEELRDEIEAYAAGSGQHFAELLRAAQDAVEAFVAAVDERNQHIDGWRQRMQDLHVPAHNNPVIPPKEHGQLGHGGQDGEIIGGRRRLQQTSAERWLTRMLNLVVHTHPGLHHIEAPTSGSGVERGQVYDDLAQLDAPAADAPTDVVFYRGPSGGVFTYDPDKEPSADEVKRLELTKISRKEAWGA